MSDNDTVNVRYMVDDVATSIDFYTKLLDFEVLTNAAPAFADVKRGNLRLLLSGPRSSASVSSDCLMKSRSRIGGTTALVSRSPTIAIFSKRRRSRPTNVSRDVSTRSAFDCATSI